MTQSREEVQEMISAYSVIYSAAAQAVHAIIQEDVNAELVGEIAAAVGGGRGGKRVRKTTVRWVRDYEDRTARPWHENDHREHWQRQPEDPLPPGVWE